MRDTADVLVVVVSTNDGRFIPVCLDALAASRDARFDVCLVVNACWDESESAARSARLPVRILRTEARFSFAEANNLAMREARTSGHRYVLLLNPDTRVHEDAIGTLRTFLDENRDYGIAGSYQIEYESDDWSSPNGWTRTTVAQALQQGHAPRAAGGCTIVDHDYVQGAALMMRADLLTRIGALDPLYGTFYEETDLCRRCRLAGFGVAIVCESRVKHFEGGNWRASSVRQRERDVLFLRNQFIYFVSGAVGVRAVGATAFAILLKQLRGLRGVGHDTRLSWWQYPSVLVGIATAMRFIPRLQRRNAAIRSASPLSPSEYAIGPTRR